MWWAGGCRESSTGCTRSWTAHRLVNKRDCQTEGKGAAEAAAACLTCGVIRDNATSKDGRSSSLGIQAMKL